MTSKCNLTEKRAEWIKMNISEIEKAATPNTGVKKHDQSSGGWGWWVRAFNMAGVGTLCHARMYFTGNCPTPSTSINRGIARYIVDNAPSGLLS